MDKTSLILRSSAHHLIIVDSHAAGRALPGARRIAGNLWKLPRRRVTIEAAITRRRSSGASPSGHQLQSRGKLEKGTVETLGRAAISSGAALRRKALALALLLRRPARGRQDAAGVAWENFRDRFFTCCLPDATPALLQHLLPRLPPWQLRDASPGRLRLCLSLVYTLLSLPSAPSCCSSAAPRTTEDPAGLI